MGGVMESILVVVVVSITMVMLLSTLVRVMDDGVEGPDHAEQLLDAVLRDDSLYLGGALIPERVGMSDPLQTEGTEVQGYCIRLLIADPLEEMELQRVGDPADGTIGYASHPVTVITEGRARAAILEAVVW
jgi:hypothetical protein